MVRGALSHWRSFARRHTAILYVEGVVAGLVLAGLFEVAERVLAGKSLGWQAIPMAAVVMVGGILTASAREVESS